MQYPQILRSILAQQGVMFEIPGRFPAMLRVGVPACFFEIPLLIPGYVTRRYLCNLNFLFEFLSPIGCIYSTISASYLYFLFTFGSAH